MTEETKALATIQESQPVAMSIQTAEPRRELVHYLPTPTELTILEAMAKYASDSRMVSSLGQVPGVMLVMLYAKELGIPPMTAVNRGFHNIQGRLQMSAYMMHLRIKQAGHKLKIKELTYEKCTLWCKRVDDDEEWEETYTIGDAARAKLVKADSAWEKDPKSQLHAAAIRTMCRRFLPEIIGPGMAEGETKDVFNDRGEFVPSATEEATKPASTRGRRKKQTVLAPEEPTAVTPEPVEEGEVVDADFFPEEPPATTEEQPAEENDPPTEESGPEPDPQVARFLLQVSTYLKESCQIKEEGLLYAYKLINEKFGVSRPDLVPVERFHELGEFCRGQLLRELQMESWIPMSLGGE